MALCRIFPNHSDIGRIKCCSNLNAFLGSPDTLTGTPVSDLPRLQAVELGYEHRNACRRLKNMLRVYRLVFNDEPSARTPHLIIVSYSSKWNMVKVLLRSLRLEIQYGKVCINNSSM